MVLLLRFATRIKTVGFKGFQGDDYMSIIVLALFTMDAATVHIICQYLPGFRNGAGSNIDKSFHWNERRSFGNTENET